MDINVLLLLLLLFGVDKLDVNFEHFLLGIVKTYNLTYQETETLQAVYTRDLCPNHIIAHSK